MTSLKLHIGTPKTGSTSLQEALWINHEKLLDQGIVYCSNLGQTNNIDIFLACLHHNEGAFGILENKGIVGQEGRQSYREDVIKRLQHNAQAAGSLSVPGCVLGSSEHFWFLWSDVHFINLKRIFSTAGLSLDEVIVYLRPQSDLLYSALSTMVRDGSPNEHIDPSCVSEHQFQYLDYYTRLATWKRYFPETRFSVFLFNDHKAKLLEHFCSICLVDLGELTPPTKMNESLTDTGIALLAELNRRYLVGLSKAESVQLLNSSNLRTRLGKMIDKYFVGKPTQHASVVSEVSSFFKASNQCLIDEFLPNRSLNELSPNIQLNMVPSISHAACTQDIVSIVDLLTELGP